LCVVAREKRGQVVGKIVGVNGRVGDIGVGSGGGGGKLAKALVGLCIPSAREPKTTRDD
jgi:hypothetical protein